MMPSPVQERRHPPPARRRGVPWEPDRAEMFIAAWRRIEFAADGKPRRELYDRLLESFNRECPRATPRQHRRAAAVLARICRVD